MRKYLIFLIVLAMLLTFTGCKSRAKTLLDGDCIRITQEGAKIAIYDVEGGVTYTFYIRHKNASKRLTEPYTAVDTPTLRIEKQYKKLLLTVKKSKEVFTISIGKVFPRITVKEGVNIR